MKENITTTYKNQPIIALTGRTDLDLSVYASAGFTTVIKKPYSPKVLLKTIENILNNDTMTTIEYVEKKIEEKATQSYSLTILKEFLASDPEALKEVITSFMNSSIENIMYLKKAIIDENDAGIKSIAHRMTPMFRQIEAQEISTILENLEQNGLENPDLKNVFEGLKTKIDTLFASLRQEIV